MISQDFFIREAEMAKTALKRLDKSSGKVLLVINSKDKLLGTITDGDIRRHILSGKSLEENIMEIYNRNPYYLKEDSFSKDEAKKILLEKRIELIPILDKEDRPIDFLTWSQVFSDAKIKPVTRTKIDVPVVIMSGGKGSRLEPFTKIFPKSLIPIGDKPIIDMVIEEFRAAGAREFYLTLNYKGEMIKLYLNNGRRDHDIRYIWEEDYLGTAGSLTLLNKKINGTFIISNCDVIVKVDFGDVVRFHKDEGALLTVLSSIQHHRIPYGVIRFKEKGKITDIVEKPEHTFSINTGVYVASKEVLKFIPHKAHFNMTDLIKVLIENNKKVIVYPVNESAYIDFGQWEEYRKNINYLQNLGVS